MLRYALHRALATIPLLLGLSVVAFVYVRLIPGDPVQAMLGPEGTAAQVAALRHELGLDRPLASQFLHWVAGLARGDLGITFGTRQQIGPILWSRVPATLELALGGFAVALILGLPAGLAAGLRKDTRLDHALSVVSLAGLSMPVFWTGTLLQILLAVRLGLLPTGGYVPFAEDPLRNLACLAMPAFSVGFGMVPYTARMMRASVIETLQEPFTAFARAKGLREKTVLLRYVLRHAICPVIAVLAMNVGLLLGGSVLIEELFLWPGMGRISVAAVLDRDYFVMQTCILAYAGLFVVVNLAADLLHASLDPRIQLR